MSLVEKSSIVSAVDDMQQSFYDYWSVKTTRSEVFHDDLELSRIMSSDFSVKLVGLPGEGFVQHLITHTSGAQVALGRSKYDQRGSVTVKVFTEADKGRYVASSPLVDQALRFFQQGTVSGVFYWSATPMELGILGRWTVVDVNAAFLYVVNRS